MPMQPDHVPHIHVVSDGKTVATLWLSGSGHVHDDGSVAAHNAIHSHDHGLMPEHGQALLDAIVEALDPSTRVAAHHCTKHPCERLQEAIHDKASRITPPTTPEKI